MIGLFRSVVDSDFNKRVKARLVDGDWQIVKLAKGVVKVGIRKNKECLGEVPEVLEALSANEFKAKYVPDDYPAVMLYDIPDKKPVRIAKPTPLPPQPPKEKPEPKPAPEDAVKVETKAKPKAKKKPAKKKAKR